MPSPESLSASPSARAGADIVELRADGRVYTGWTAVEVTIGIDGAASAFSLELAERSPSDGQGSEPQPWLARAGSEAVISIDGTVLITGWIDAVEVDLDSTTHSLLVRGRSKAADLIDCSAIVPTGSFTGRTIAQIATALAQPFGLSVAVRGPVGAPFPKFAIQPGESVFEAIERAAKMRGLLIVSDPDGGLALISPAPVGPSVRIAQGEHIERLRSRHDVAERYSDYSVRGQSAGDDDTNGRAASQVHGSARDAGVRRHRPLLVVAEDQASASSARTRAEWEATVRAARSQGADVTIAGWRLPDGSLPLPMRSIDLAAPAGFVEGAMIVASVTFRKDGSGSFVELALSYPETYRPEPVPTEASRIRGRRRA